MTTQTFVILAPDVAARLGDDPYPMLAATLRGGYRCTVCGHLADATPASPAAVLLLHTAWGDGPTLIRFAHPTCSPSGARTVTWAAEADPVIVTPATAVLRPAGDDPAALVLIGPTTTTVAPCAGGDTQNRYLSHLLGTGFDLFTDPAASLPVLDGLAATFTTDGTLSVRDETGASLYDGELPRPAAFDDTVRRTGRLGVVVAYGLRLRNPDRDHVADLCEAMDAGLAVGAAVYLDPIDRPL
jgi:hypothetical protein